MSEATDENKVFWLAIGARLKFAREQAGLSLGQVVWLVPMRRETLVKIEAGNRRSGEQNLTPLAKLYQVSEFWLVTGKPESPDPTLGIPARELEKLEPEDRDHLVRILSMLHHNPQETQ